MVNLEKYYYRGYLKDKTSKTDDGREFYIDDSNLKTIEVKCEDGMFVMPSYRICFKG